MKKYFRFTSDGEIELLSEAEHFNKYVEDILAEAKPTPEERQEVENLVHSFDDKQKTLAIGAIEAEYEPFDPNIKEFIGILTDVELGTYKLLSGIKDLEDLGKWLDENWIDGWNPEYEEFLDSESIDYEGLAVYQYLTERCLDKFYAIWQNLNEYIKKKHGQEFYTWMNDFTASYEGH